MHMSTHRRLISDLHGRTQVHEQPAKKVDKLICVFTFSDPQRFFCFLFITKKTKTNKKKKVEEEKKEEKVPGIRKHETTCVFFQDIGRLLMHLCATVEVREGAGVPHHRHRGEISARICRCGRTDIAGLGAHPAPVDKPRGRRIEFPSAEVHRHPTLLQLGLLKGACTPLEQGMLGLRTRGAEQRLEDKGIRGWRARVSKVES